MLYVYLLVCNVIFDWRTHTQILLGSLSHKDFSSFNILVLKPGKDLNFSFSLFILILCSWAKYSKMLICTSK